MGGSSREAFETWKTSLCIDSCVALLEAAAEDVVAPPCLYCIPPVCITFGESPEERACV